MITVIVGLTVAYLYAFGIYQIPSPETLGLAGLMEIGVELVIMMIWAAIKGKM